MQQPSSSNPGRILLIPSLLVLAGFACLTFDVPLARVLIDDFLPRDIRAIFRRAEFFGHAYGIASIAITIHVLDLANRRRIPRLICTALAAGLAADALKLTVWRARPRTMELLDQSPSTFIGSPLTHASFDLGMIANSENHSFPSAHAATAVAMFVVLSHIYPRGRWWFAAIALFCALNRVDGGAHYASDVCWGAALGYVMANVCLGSKLLDRFLARWEQPREPAAASILSLENKRRAA